MEKGIRENEYGKYEDVFNEQGVLVASSLLEPTQKWFNEISIDELEPKLPTETEILTDYIVDVDYRVTMIELGL